MAGAGAAHAASSDLFAVEEGRLVRELKTDADLGGRGLTRTTFRTVARPAQSMGQDCGGRRASSVGAVAPVTGNVTIGCEDVPVHQIRRIAKDSHSGIHCNDPHTTECCDTSTYGMT